MCALSCNSVIVVPDVLMVSPWMLPLDACAHADTKPFMQAAITHGSNSNETYRPASSAVHNKLYNQGRKT
jgi:hypothetical protein